MTCVIGLDLGTSAVKAVLTEADTAHATAEMPLTTARPSPGASEQDPGAWWTAATGALDALRAAAPDHMRRVRAIGLTGQMHATVLLDSADRPVRPAMLWDDARATAEAAALKALGPAIDARMGVLAMAGFTGPKLLWLAHHEPDALARGRILLLPKDVLRLHLTGERATDPSDAAGTWLFDQQTAAWDAEAFAACQADPALAPALCASDGISGIVRANIADRFGLPRGVVVAGGGGDTPCGGLGIAAVTPGNVFAHLGSSAQLFVTAATHHPSPARATHAFHHALPGLWYRMAAMLNGASILATVARLTGQDIAAVTAAAERNTETLSPLLFLPYLNGERTPHDDPHARGVLFGLHADSTAAEIARAAMEGVAFTFADAAHALDLGRPDQISLIGGGARSALWARLLAAVLGTPIVRHTGGERGPAFGAARLARLALGEARADVLTAAPVRDITHPDPALAAACAPRIAAFRTLYAALRPLFRESPA